MRSKQADLGLSELRWSLGPKLEVHLLQQRVSIVARNRLCGWDKPLAVYGFRNFLVRIAFQLENSIEIPGCCYRSVHESQSTIVLTDTSIDVTLLS